MRILSTVVGAMLVGTLSAQRPPAATELPAPAGAVTPPIDIASNGPGLLIDAPTSDTTWVLTDGYKARVTAEGLLFHALPGVELPLVPLQFTLDRVTVAGAALPLETTKLPDEGRRCTLDHRTLREQFELREDGVEQSFWFASLPTRGELVIRIGVATTLRARMEHDGVQFGDGPQGVRYGSAVAFDRAGRRCELPSTWTDGGLQITVPADFVAAAELPLVVDPLVSASVTVATGAPSSSATAVGRPDVAYDPVSNQWLVVWEWRKALTDRDVFARVYDAAWNAVGAVIAVDVSTVDWHAPSVAYRGKTADWLVVAARIVNGTSPTWSIAGRRLPPSGVAAAAFAISPTYPVPGLPKGPFVGGDPYVGIGVAVSVVAWSRGFGIEFCAIDHTGAIGPLQTLAPGSTVREVTLSKSNRTDRWALGWMEEPFSSSTMLWMNNRVALLDLFGNPIPLSGGATSVSVGGGMGSTSLLWFATCRMRVSSPDLQGAFTVAFHDNVVFGQTIVRRVDATGTTSPAASMNTLAPGFGAPEIALETDGVRTLLVRNGGTGVRGVLLACDPATGVFEAHDDFTTSGTVTTTSVAVASAYAASLANDITPFTIATGHANGSQTRVHQIGYRGYAPQQGFTTIFTACGSLLPIQHDSVLPVLGNTFSVSLGTTFPVVGFLFGRPTAVPLTGICPCTIGVDGSILAGPTATFPVPLDVTLVGELFSIQGFTFQSGPCFSGVSFSNTIDIRIL